jgi:nicotinamide mononucleotide transporter
MNLLDVYVPLWLLDVAGSACVLVSLYFLFAKRLAYWHWSNASLVPYFAMFAASRQYMLAGLQLCYLVFGLHGLWLWRLECERDERGRSFDERFWYQLGWLLSLAIFAVSAAITQFSDGWTWLQFAITSFALLANWATTRKWSWSWWVWIGVNTLSAVYFAHHRHWAQFALQFVLAGLSLHGLREWTRVARAPREGGVSVV